MNAEKIYTLTKEAMTAYAESAEDFPKTIDESFIAYCECYGLHKPFTALYRLNKDAMEEMYNKSARNSSKPSLSAIKRILKNAEGRVMLTKAWWQDGLWVVCDGYRMVGLKEAIPSIPTYDETVDKYQTMDAKKIYLPLFDGTPMEEIEIPQKGEIKQAILDAKAKGDKKKLIKVGVRFFNAQYLLDVLEILPNARMYQRDENPYSIVFFKGEDGNIGLLCPVRP